MNVQVEVVGYGRGASELLADAVAHAQEESPLDPVTVIVPSNYVGLSARRLLGSGSLRRGPQNGLANVSFVTPFRLAELAGSDLLLDRRPITNPVLGAAVRQVLADDPDVYRNVAEHESTEAALAAMFAELSNVDAAGLESIEDEGSAAAVLAVRLHRRIAAKLRAYHTEHDLATAAADRPDLHERLARFGHLIWYLPAPSTAAVGRFVGEALHAARGSTAIVGLTGVEAADEAVWRTCEAAGVERRRRVVEPATADEIVSVTDAPEEVREVCARIVALVDAGVRLDRIGVFYPAPDPYVRIIEQQFTAAGLPANGPDPRRVTDSVAGRTLLGALGLPDARWRRDRVIALVSGAPLRFDGEPVRPAVWDDLSRRAGVVIDHGDWRRKIEHHLIGLERGGLHDRVADAQRLIAFVDRLADAVAAVERAGGWAGKCAAATDLLHELLGSDRHHARWPEHEQQAFARVEDSLDRLASLGDIEPEPTPSTFERALRNELDVARGRRGRFGHGVVYGPLATAVGHDLDAVFVVGCAEGRLPVPRRDDTILPDSVRLRSLDQLELRSARLHHQHRAFLAVLAAAPVGRRTLTFARGDLRSNRRALPSRWLLDSASALAGEPVYATDFDEPGRNVVTQVVTHVDSFAGAIGAGTTATLGDRDLVALAGVAGRPERAARHELVQLVGRGIESQTARASSRFTEFDGNLAAQVGAEPSPLPGPGDHPLSPSRLETWAGCGFRYFLGHVLGIGERDDPERVEEISALDRGSLAHEVLERFVAEAIETGPPRPSETWSAQQRRRLHEIADEVCLAYERTGRTGRRMPWRVRRDDLHDVLDAWLVADDAFRAANGATPAHVELDLGVRSGEPVPFQLANATSITLRGRIDRVDTTDDGRVLVNDYKTGKGARYANLSDDPFVGGTTLQLGMYAEGAMRATGMERAESHYWLVEHDPSSRPGYAWDDAKRARFHEVLEAITTGISSGVFAAVPGEWNSWRNVNENCTYCEFDAVCVRDRGDHAEHKAASPELEVRVALTPRDHEADESDT